MNQHSVDPKEVVMSYIGALDDQRYEEAMGLLHDGVRIRGPAGETFGRPLDFIEMLRKYKGRYDIKKVFADEADVCVLYDLVTTGATMYMCSWYQVKDGKIVSVRTVFDTKTLGSPTGNGSGGAGR